MKSIKLILWPAHPEHLFDNVTTKALNIGYSIYRSFFKSHFRNQPVIFCNWHLVVSNIIFRVIFNSFSYSGTYYKSFSFLFVTSLLLLKRGSTGERQTHVWWVGLNLSHRNSSHSFIRLTHCNIGKIVVYLFAVFK